ncbi:hypothetical protein ACFE04_021247 [Oxalis oulophora]
MVSRSAIGASPHRRTSASFVRIIRSEDKPSLPSRLCAHDENSENPSSAEVEGTYHLESMTSCFSIGSTPSLVTTRIDFASVPFLDTTCSLSSNCVNVDEFVNSGYHPYIDDFRFIIVHSFRGNFDTSTLFI